MWACLKLGDTLTSGHWNGYCRIMVRHHFFKHWYRSWHSYRLVHIRLCITHLEMDTDTCSGSFGSLMMAPAPFTSNYLDHPTKLINHLPKHLSSYIPYIYIHIYIYITILKQLHPSWFPRNEKKHRPRRLCSRSWRLAPRQSGRAWHVERSKGLRLSWLFR